MSNWEKTMKEWDDSIPDGIKYLSAENRVLTRKVRELESENANLTARIAELEAERDQAKAIVSRLRDFLFDHTQFHISTNPEERWWALVDKFDELVKEREE